MAADGRYLVPLPSSLMEDVEFAVIRERTSIRSFVVQAVAEKIAALRERGRLTGLSPDEQAEFMATKAERGSARNIQMILAITGGPDSIAGDEIPEGWLSERPTATPRRTA